MMIVDDHAIDSLKPWFEPAYEELKKEWGSGKYKEFIDCPSFKATTAYYEAMNVLSKARYGNERKTISLQEMIDDELEVENFWKDKNG